MCDNLNKRMYATDSNWIQMVLTGTTKSQDECGRLLCEQIEQLQAGMRHWNDLKRSESRILSKLDQLDKEQTEKKNLIGEEVQKVREHIANLEMKLLKHAQSSKEEELSGDSQQNHVVSKTNDTIKNYVGWPIIVLVVALLIAVLLPRIV